MIFILHRTRFLVSFAAKIIALALFVPALALAQADYAREKRWADEITPAILVGDPLYLALPSGHKFLAIHAPHAPARAEMIRKVRGSAQIEVSGADQFFTGREQDLVSQVRLFLDQRLK